MEDNIHIEQIVPAAVAAVRRALPGAADLAIVGGSGLAVLADIGRELAALDFAAIPGLGGAAVAGHAGRWLLCEVAGRRVYCLLGRRHLYEGIDPPQAAFAVRLLAALGVREVILTNAAGGLGPALRTGDLMLIRDHLNLMARNPFQCGMPGTADGPVRNPADSGIRHTAPDTYDATLSARLARAALSAGIVLKQGVYAAVAGPSYETRAEVELLRRLGADAVGMSTVPEALAAARAGLRVGAVSLITNSHWYRGGPASHQEVLEAAARSGARLAALLRRFVEDSAPSTPGLP